MKITQSDDEFFRFDKAIVFALPSSWLEQKSPAMRGFFIAALAKTPRPAHVAIWRRIDEGFPSAQLPKLTRLQRCQQAQALAYFVHFAGHHGFGAFAQAQLLIPMNVFAKLADVVRAACQ
jgi:hypothetical protein